MGQNNSRSMVLGPPVIPNSSFPTSIGSYSAIDANTMGAITVEQPILFPQSEGGNAVTNFVYSPISTPFQIVQWGDPYQDEYVTSAVKDCFDIQSLFFEGMGKEIRYTYLYTITGWTAFDGKNATTDFENPILDCCSSGGGCADEKYPNSKILHSCPGILDIITKKSESCCCDTKMNLVNSNTYIFIQKQASLYNDLFKNDLWCPTTFQAYLNAYIIVVNQIEVFVGINPFCCIEAPKYGRTLYQAVTYIQFTYSYMIYVQLILLDSFSAIDRKHWALVNMAIDFVSKYARLLWTVNEVFDYEYTHREYLAMYNRRWIEHVGLIRNSD